jgi:hypothetical protein
MWFVPQANISSGTTVDIGAKTNITTSYETSSPSAFDFGKVAWAGGVSGGDMSKVKASQSHEVFVNGMLQKPEMSSGNFVIRTSDSAYTPTTGDYVLVNDGATIGIRFAYQIRTSDIVKVVYR